MFRRRKLLWLPVVAVAIMAALTAFCPGKTTAAEEKTNAAAELESAFVDVAEKVGPAVVSISTEQTEEMTYPGYPRSQDELIDRFFREFFGQEPGPGQGQGPGQGPGRTYQRKHRGLGSGVIIDKEGYILTNHHVVDKVDKITVTLSDGRKFPAEMKGFDVRYDLAVIKIKGGSFKFAPLGNSDQLRVGQWVIALGNPFGFAQGKSPEPSVSVGVISALHRALFVERGGREYSDLVQTDAAINPGNSGGPLVNLAGEVIGVNSAIATTSGTFAGVSFAIPINTAEEVIGRLVEGKKMTYGYLGVLIQDLNEDLAGWFGLADQEGAVVQEIVPGSPAEKAGVQQGDVIRAYNGEKIKGVHELLKRVGRTEVGKKIKLGIVRKSGAAVKEMTLEVQVVERPEEGVVAKAGEPAAAGAWRGLDVKEITPELARSFKLAAKEGVVVVNVAPDSPADEAGLSQGVVIDEINQRRIKTLADYRQAVGEAQGNVLLRTSAGYIVIKPEEAKKGN